MYMARTSTFEKMAKRDTVLPGIRTHFYEKVYRVKLSFGPNLHDIQSETGKLLTTKDLSNLKMKIMKGQEQQSEESKENIMDQPHQEGIEGAWLHATW